MRRPPISWAHRAAVAILVAVFLVVPPAPARAAAGSPGTCLGSACFVASIPVGVSPEAGVYDPLNGDLYFSNNGPGGNEPPSTVSVISGSSNSVIASPVVGAFPLPPTLDMGTGELYVPGIFEHNSPLWVGGETVLSGNNVPLNSPILLPEYPEPVSEPLAFDPGNGNLYGAGWGNVSIFDGENNTLSGFVTVPGSGSPPPPGGRGERRGLRCGAAVPALDLGRVARRNLGSLGQGGQLGPGLS